MGLMYMASWTSSMAHVFFHSLQPINGCSFIFSVSLVQTSTEVLLLLSLELPSMHINWNEEQGAPLYEQPIWRAWAHSPFHGSATSHVLLSIVCYSNSDKQIYSEASMEKGGHDPLWPTHSSATGRDKTYNLKWTIKRNLLWVLHSLCLYFVALLFISWWEVLHLSNVL